MCRARLHESRLVEVVVLGHAEADTLYGAGHLVRVVETGAELGFLTAVVVPDNERVAVCHTRSERRKTESTPQCVERT